MYRTVTYDRLMLHFLCIIQCFSQRNWDAYDMYKTKKPPPLTAAISNHLFPRWPTSVRGLHPSQPVRLISLYSWHRIRQGLGPNWIFIILLYCTSFGHLCEIECTQQLIITSHAMNRNTKFHHKQKSETMKLIKFSDIDLYWWPCFPLMHFCQMRYCTRLSI